MKVSVECPYCGESFTKLKDGKIPTHDFPKPCRSVCRGSGMQPRYKDSPLYKDDPKQQERDFIREARQELLIYGFAVVKNVALMRNEPSGDMDCPLCGGSLHFGLSTVNEHCAAKCKTPNCINMME